MQVPEVYQELVEVSHSNTLQHTATHCNTLQHTLHCNAHCRKGATGAVTRGIPRANESVQLLSRQQSAPRSISHCNTLQHTATHCRKGATGAGTRGIPRASESIQLLPRQQSVVSNPLLAKSLTATHCNTLQHTLHCNTQEGRDLFGCPRYTKNW